MRTVVIVVLAVLALLAALHVTGAVDVGAWFVRGPSAVPGPDLEAPATGPAGAALEGAVGAGRTRAPVGALGSEVFGSVPRGARLVGRVVEAGVTPQPVAGARVVLARPHPITRYLGTRPEGRWDELEAVTDPAGRFAFADVRPAKGYVVRAHVGARPTASSSRLEVSARQVVDLGDLVLQEGGAFTGRLRDGLGLPIVGARLAVTWRVETILGMVLFDPAMLPEIEAEARSDEQGRFALEGLEPGPKTLVIATAEHGGRVLAKLEALTGQRQDLGEIVFGGTGALAGRVEWEDGTPVEQARVFAAEPRLDRPTVSSTVTGRDGSFRLENLEGEAGRLGVFVPGIPIQPTENVPLGTLDVVLRLPLGGGVVGRVVRKSDGRPVTSFGVRFLPKDDEEWKARAVRKLVDGAVGPLGFAHPEGSFRIPFQARGRYVLLVTADGFPEQASEPFEIPARGTVDVGSIVLADGHALAGTVRTRLGPPLAGARITLLSGDTALRVDRADVLPGGLPAETQPDTLSDGEGRFLLPAQTPAVYALFVEHPHAARAVVRDIDLRAGPRADVEVVLEPAGEVQVRVLDARGRPADDVDLLLVRPDGFALNEATREGGQARWSSVPPGPCLVRAATLGESAALLQAAYTDDGEARAGAYEALRREGGERWVRAGELTEVVLHLPARVDVTLRVRPWVGDLAPLRSASLRHKASSWRRYVRTDEVGVFRVPLEPGAYEVRVFPESGWDDSRVFEIVVPDAPTAALDLGG